MVKLQKKYAGVGNLATFLAVVVACFASCSFAAIETNVSTVAELVEEQPKAD